MPRSPFSPLLFFPFYSAPPLRASRFCGRVLRCCTHTHTHTGGGCPFPSSFLLLLLRRRRCRRCVSRKREPAAERALLSFLVTTKRLSSHVTLTPANGKSARPTTKTLFPLVLLLLLLSLIKKGACTSLSLNCVCFYILA